VQPLQLQTLLLGTTECGVWRKHSVGVELHPFSAHWSGQVEATLGNDYASFIESESC
jgi:hypothetical protein